MYRRQQTHEPHPQPTLRRRHHALWAGRVWGSRQHAVKRNCQRRRTPRLALHCMRLVMRSWAPRNLVHNEQQSHNYSYVHRPAGHPATSGTPTSGCSCSLQPPGNNSPHCTSRKRPTCHHKPPLIVRKGGGLLVHLSERIEASQATADCWLLTRERGTATRTAPAYTGPCCPSSQRIAAKARCQ